MCKACDDQKCFTEGETLPNTDLYTTSTDEPDCMMCIYGDDAGNSICDWCENHDKFEYAEDVEPEIPEIGADRITRYESTERYCKDCIHNHPIPGHKCHECSPIGRSNWEIPPETTKESVPEPPVEPAGKDIDPDGIGQHKAGAKLDGTKLKWHLLPLDVIEGVVDIMTFGANKYSENGWKSVDNAVNRYFSAMMRHYRAIQNGEHLDPESGKPHAHHFCCNAVFMTYFMQQEPDQEKS